jgi:mevalonate kinase
MKINVPGKTFLVGEYAVLAGGPALGLATRPCFEITYGGSNALSFHPESPAGKYLKDHPTFSISMTDPYPGGFGRSTAEYLAVLGPRLHKSPVGFSTLLNEYKSLCSGSGIDLAFQYFGKVCLADQAIGFYQTFDWHFTSLDFFIVSTGLKVPTHEHLKNLDSAKPLALVPLADHVARLYAQKNEAEFLYQLKQWCETLQSMELTHENSLALIQELRDENILLSKPCGALGADVLLVFFSPEKKETVRQLLIEKGLRIQADSFDLSEGVAAQLKRYRGQNVG